MHADPENEICPADQGESPTHHDAKRVLNSRELFAGQHEVLIEHDTEIYRLRITRNGKLILQK